MNPFRHRRLKAMVEAYVDGELRASEADLVRTHLAECWWCSGDEQTHRLVRAALHRRRDRAASLPVARLRRFVHGLGRE